MLGIVVSRADSASVAIGEQLLRLEDWETDRDDSRADGDGGGTVYRAPGVVLREFDALHLHLDGVAAAFADPDLLVFASRHSGETGPLLTAHHTGNFGSADHGGRANDLARACPNAHDRVLDALEAAAPPEYEVGMECTHHGPSEVGAPSMFVEIGSAEPQWADEAAARAVARAILDLRNVSPDRERDDGEDRNRRHLVGIGGGHYAPRFERVVRETSWAVGHVAADWGLAALGDPSEENSERVLERAFTQSKAVYGLVDGDRPDVESAIERLGYRAVSETWVRETDGVPLAFVHTVESEVLSVADGLRFGTPAVSVDPEGDDSEFVVVSLPGDLLEETRGIDRDATYEVVAEEALAFGTDQGGTRVTGPVVIANEGVRDRIVDRLLDVLQERYETVQRDGDTVVARRRSFDPERARTLGVPEGPAFGRLASGRPVEVDGETIPPETVRTEQERRFPLD